MNLKEVLLSFPMHHLHEFSNAQEVVNRLNQLLPPDVYVSITHTNNTEIYQAILSLEKEDQVELLSTYLEKKESADYIGTVIIVIVTIIVSFILMLSTLAGMPVNQDGQSQSVFDELIEAIAKSLIDDLQK